MNFIEFFIRHPNCSHQFRSDISEAFVSCKSAYRVVQNTIVPIANEQQAEAVAMAMEASGSRGLESSKAHIMSAVTMLRTEDWAGSIRESIHACEAAAIRIAGDGKSLGDALNRIEKSGRLHGALKKALSSLYGYASDEEGIRHALVFKDKSSVDEHDALFMLGACASFVSYLIARSEST